MPLATRLGTITIADTTTQGSILGDDKFAGFRQLIIFGPAVLAETITVQVAPEANAINADLRTLKYNGGAAITFTGPSAMVIDCGGFRALSLVAGAGVAGAKVFTVHGIG